MKSALHSWVIITSAKQTAALEGDTDKPSLAVTPPSSQKDRWKEICIDEAIRISELLEMMRQHWGADHFPVITIQPATIAAFALLEDVENRPETGAAFYKLCLVLRAASRRFRVNRGVLRLLDKTAKQNGVTLPDGCADLLVDVDPNAMELDQRSATGVIDQLGLDYLLEKWEDLDLEETY